MKTDPLQTLLRLRALAVDDLRREMAEALAAEDAAAAAREAAERAIHDETRIAAESEGDGDVERFARWLVRGRARLLAAEQAVATTAAVTSAKRAELNLARAAAEATGKAIEQRAGVERQRVARVAQREQDEIGQRRR